MLRAQRTVRNEEDKTLFSLGRSAESFSVSPVSDQLAQPEGASSGTTGLERGSTTRPGAGESAASFVGSGVSGSRERSIKFRLRHSGVSKAVRELPLRSSPECLSSCSTVSVFVCLRLRLSSLQCQMVGPKGVGCRSDVLHRGSGNRRGVRVLRFTVLRKVR